MTLKAMKTTTRRFFSFGLTASAAATLSTRTTLGDRPDTEVSSWPIGVCDWTMSLSQNLEAFTRAKEFGLSGVQVGFGDPEAAGIDLRKKEDRALLFAKSAETGVRVASLGMAVLNRKPYASEPDSERWVSEVIDVVAAMKMEFPTQAPSVVLLAFFGKADLNGKPEATAEVIARLRKVASRAEQAGVILGIESLLSIEDHLRILDGVASSCVQVYYDTANSDRMGYDIYDEVARLGSERICEIHCKENGARIGEGKIDFARFRTVLEKIGYEKWLILEGSRVKGNELADDYRANSKALRRIFGA